MRPPAPLRALDLRLDPIDAIGAWPKERPLAALISSGPRTSRSRWSILAEPREWCHPSAIEDGVARLQAISRTLEDTRDGARRAPHEPPFRSGWIGVFGFDLASGLEPAMGAAPPAGPDGCWPCLALARCETALIHDRETDRWFASGTPDPPALEPGLATPGTFDIGPVDSGTAPERYRRDVRRVLEFIAAGDVFQVNLTQRLHASFSGDRRSLAQRALRTALVPYGAYLELADGQSPRSIVSLSPELFLECAADGAIATCPIKGTRPDDHDPALLASSAKDAAELNMIVDLMRNDLGRICDYGSVRVARRRSIETHPSVHHGVAEIVGRMRPGLTHADILTATFPPGSVTGAPKIRAMQIIHELEPERRGPYCGAIGFLDDRGAMTLNVAIRTLMLSGDRLAYGTGAGIVADSDPDAELEECLVKAEVLRRVAGQAAERPCMTSM